MIIGSCLWCIIVASHRAIIRTITPFAFTDRLSSRLFLYDDFTRSRDPHQIVAWSGGAHRVCGNTHRYAIFSSLSSCMVLINSNPNSISNPWFKMYWIDLDTTLVLYRRQVDVNCSFNGLASARNSVCFRKMWLSKVFEWVWNIPTVICWLISHQY